MCTIKLKEKKKLKHGGWYNMLFLLLLKKLHDVKVSPRNCIKTSSDLILN